MKKLILVIAVFSLCCAACVEDDIMIVNAPCEWAATFSAVSDTCFDLPRNPNGSVFSVPHEIGFSYTGPVLDPVNDGRLYFLKTNQPNPQEVILMRTNLCMDTTNPTEVLASGRFGSMKINSIGDLIFLGDTRTVVHFDASENQFDTLYNDIYTIDLFWLNNTSVATSIYVEESNQFQYVAYDLNGIVLDTLPILNANSSNQNTGKIALHNGDGDLMIYNTESLEFVKSIPRPEDWQGAIHTTWIDNERLILLIDGQILTLLNIETEEEVVLFDYSACENIALYSPMSDSFNNDRILLHYVEHRLNENQQLRQRARILYYNIATGEEQILELE